MSLITMNDLHGNKYDIVIPIIRNVSCPTGTPPLQKQIKVALSLIILAMELYVSGKLSGQDVVRWWSERGRDVVRWWSEPPPDHVSATL